jgi:NADH-quinone oxidoreductase subunit H
MNLGELLNSLLNLQLFAYLRTVYGSDPVTELLFDVVGVITVSTFCLLIVILLIWLERKIIARMQDRIGPNRVGGRYGLLQTVADVIKLLTKELITPAGADWLAYNLAPFLIVMTALMMWAVMPFAPGLIGVELNVAVFYVLSISSVSVVSLLLAGWGSNNKYALLGAFRSVAQLVSYEVPMVLSLIVPIILARTMGMDGIVQAQTVPFLFMVPLAAFIFLLSAVAETGRTPFDLLEAESEIVAGFHVEYGGMKFGMFFLAEFVGTLFMSGFFASLFLGGYRLVSLELLIPGFVTPPLVGLVVFFVKMFFMYFVFVWLRATFPRVRIDQMLDLNWKLLVPVTLLLVLAVAILDQFVGDAELWVRTAVHFTSNVVIFFITLEMLRRFAHRQRYVSETVPAPQPGPVFDAPSGAGAAAHD